MIKYSRIFIIGLFGLSLLESGCYFFRKRSLGENAGSTGVVGASLGARAGGLDQEALSLVHGTVTPHAPAAIRPDPDLFVRQLLLQYREEGAAVAREISRVENFRLLLGGANENFSVNPQETYDATSLLAQLKVAEEVCRGLVAPDPSDHPGWQSILPHSPDESDANIRFLVQRIVGLPSDKIASETVVSLQQILETALDDNGYYVAESYIPVCATLILDAGSLLL